MDRFSCIETPLFDKNHAKIKYRHSKKEAHSSQDETVKLKEERDGLLRKYRREIEEMREQNKGVSKERDAFKAQCAKAEANARDLAKSSLFTHFEK